MNDKFVDTNVFIEIFARSGDKSEQSKKLLRKSENLFTSSLVISEMEWVLRYAYDKSREDVVTYLKSILSSEIGIDGKKQLIEALNYYETYLVDWTDCLNMFFVKDKGGKEVYSYDKGLSKFDWIKRLDP